MIPQKAKIHLKPYTHQRNLKTFSQNYNNCKLDRQVIWCRILILCVKMKGNLFIIHKFLTLFSNSKIMITQNHTKSRSNWTRWCKIQLFCRKCWVWQNDWKINLWSISRVNILKSILTSLKFQASTISKRI